MAGAILSKRPKQRLCPVWRKRANGSFPILRGAPGVMIEFPRAKHTARVILQDAAHLAIAVNDVLFFRWPEGEDPWRVSRRQSSAAVSAYGQQVKQLR